MKQLFLTSATNFVAEDLVNHLDLSNDNKLIFIETPAEPEEGDKKWLEDDKQSLIRNGFNVTSYTITGKNSSQLEKDLHPFNYIYVSGGNTFYLLQQSIKSGFVELVRNMVINQEKTYIGTSAGSVIAGPKLPEYLTQLDEPLKTGLVGAAAYNLSESR